MTWNVAPECVSAILLGILILYYQRSVTVAATRDRMYLSACYVVLATIAVNLLSTWMLYRYERFPHWLVMGVTTLYYILTPLMPVLYVMYSILILYYNYAVESFRRIGSRWNYIFIPYALYLVLILANPFLHNVFCVLPGQGYVRKPLYGVPYLLFYLYCAYAIFIALRNRKNTEPEITRALLFFPCLSFVFIVFQAFFPDIILTGTAAFSSLFIMYLYLQNQRLTVDDLTGLLNRQALVHALDQAAASHKKFAVAVISLTNFKGVNDRFGVDKGDQLLCQMADYLRTIVDKSCLFRYNGDQFLLLLCSMDRTAMERVAALFGARMEQTWSAGELECRLNASTAFLLCPESGTDAKEILSAADYAVSYAKKSGRRGMFRYDNAMRAAAQRRQAVAEALNAALQEDGFFLNCQPVWSAADGCFHHGEALLRMKPGPLGPLYPDEFIPVAEETGQIVEITYRVIELSCELLNRMDAAGAGLETISVNFSFAQFLQADVRERVGAILKRYGVAPSRLHIEITERTVAEDLPLVAGLMDAMHRDGFLFYLDDFGTGYSNVSTILQLPFDTVKLDKSVATDFGESGRGAQIMYYLVQGLQAVGLKIVAEGIETPEQLALVLRWGCAQIQGYLFAKPMAEEPALAFLSARKNLPTLQPAAGSREPARVL